MRTALVSGGNKGIGFELCRILAKEHPEFRLFLGARDPERGKAAVNSLLSETGADPDRLCFVQLDVEDPKSVEAAARVVQEKSGGLDVLINNAGWAAKGSRFDAEVVRQTLAVNFLGVARVCDAFFPLLRDGARVVTVSSRAGLWGYKGISPELQARFSKEDLSLEELQTLANEFLSDVQSSDAVKKGWVRNSYQISKLLVSMYTRILARDYQGPAKDVLINAGCPGWCRTDMAGDQAPLSAEDGARALIPLAFLPLASPTGKFWYDGAFRSFYE
jgi:carbonyl reductase 1